MAKTILVKNEQGQLGHIPLDQAQDALREGYSLATPEEAKEQRLQSEYGEGFGTELQAFGEGALRGLSIGLSDAAMRGLGVSAEGLRERRERNPIASTTGEIAGVAAPLIASSVAGPAGPAGVIAARTPVGLLARGSMAAGEAGAAALQGSRVANVLGRATAPALGSAIEGAAYGLGASVSEDMLGESGINAERVVQNVGLGGLFGGALGGFFGSLARATPETIVDDAVRATTDSVNPQNIDEVARASGIDEGYIASFGRERAGASKTRADADILGAPVAPGMVGGKEVQKLSDMIRASSSAPARAHSAIYDQGFEIAEKKTLEALGEMSGKSMAEVGDELKDSFIRTYETKTKPFEEGYERLRESTSHIQISDKSKERIANNIYKLKVNNYNSDQKALIDDVVRNLMDNTTTVEGLRSIVTGVNKAATEKPELWGVSGDIAERLGSFVDRSIVKAVNEMPAGLRGEGKKILTEKAALGESYKGFRKQMNQLGEALFGGKRINGPQHFLKLLDDTNPEKFAAKLFTKKNAKHLSFMSQNFPQETELLKRYVKDQMVKKAGGIKGEMARMNSIFKEYDGLEKEARNFLFNAEERKVIEAAKGYLGSFPPKFNGSNTAHAADTLQFWSSPTSAIGITARDYAMVKAIKGLGPLEQRQAKALTKLEKLIRTTSTKVEDGTRAIVRGSRQAFKNVPAGALGSAGGAGAIDNDDEKSTLKLINDLSSDPERLIEKLDGATNDLMPFAPKISTSVGVTATNAVQFLASKAPVRPNMGPLAGEYEFSQQEISKFNRYADIVEDPVSILEQVASGTLTSEAMETIQNVYPALYSEMKLSLLSQITERAADGGILDIPYSSKIAMSMFMQEDLMISLAPAQISMNQMSLAKTGGGQERQGAGDGMRTTQKGLSDLTKSSRMMTPMQASNQRGVNDVS